MTTGKPPTEPSAEETSAVEPVPAEPVTTETARVEPSTDEFAAPDMAEPETTPEPAAGHTPKVESKKADDEHFALFDEAEADELRTRWRAVQTAFVDDPKGAVRDADQLVTRVIRTLTAQKNELDEQLHGRPAETEELRLALRRYRTLFNQLLNT